MNRELSIEVGQFFHPPTWIILFKLFYFRLLSYILVILGHFFRALKISSKNFASLNLSSRCLPGKKWDFKKVLICPSKRYDVGSVKSWGIMVSQKSHYSAVGKDTQPDQATSTHNGPRDTLIQS